MLEFSERKQELTVQRLEQFKQILVHYLDFVQKQKVGTCELSTIGVMVERLIYIVSMNMKMFPLYSFRN